MWYLIFFKVLALASISFMSNLGKLVTSINSGEYYLQREASLASGKSTGAVGSHVMAHKALATIGSFPALSQDFSFLFTGKNYCYHDFTNKESRFRKVQWLSQGHTSRKDLTWDPNQFSEFTNHAHNYYPVPGHGTWTSLGISFPTYQMGTAPTQCTPIGLKSKLMCKWKVLIIIREMLLYWMQFKMSVYV